MDATGTKHKDHTTGDHSHTTGTHTTGTHTTGDHSVDHPSHSKGPAALGGPSVTASTAPMHNTGTGHRDESKDPLTSSQLGVHSSEHSRAQGGTPLVAKPVGTDLGDKLHGTDRNRGAHSGDVGHHAGGEHSTHVGHGHTTGEHGTRNTSGHNPLTSGTTGSHEPSTHHIGGETSSHVGHGHTGHHTGAHEKTNLTGGSHGTSGLTGSNQQSGLTGTHGTSGLTGSRQQSGLAGSHDQSGLTGNHGSSALTGTHGSSGLTGSHEKSGLTGNQESTHLPGSNTGLTGHNNTTDSGAPAGFNPDERRGTTSGAHTDPAIHHVPAVGHTKTDV